MNDVNVAAPNFNISSFEPGRQLAPSSSGGVAWTNRVGLHIIQRGRGRETRLLDIIEILRDFDADVASAVWTFLRTGNPGHQVKVFGANGGTDAEGQAYVNELAKRVWQQGGGGADTLVDTMLLTLYSAGGIGLDIALTPDLHDIDDVYPFGPDAIEFAEVVESEDAMPLLVMLDANRRNGPDRAALNPRQVRYLPLDPDTRDPYGRSALLPAIDTLNQMTELIADQIIASRIHGQGQKDVTLDVEAALRLAPSQLVNDPAQADALNSWLENLRANVEQQLAAQTNRDMYVHWSNTTISSTTPGAQAIDVNAIIEQLARRLRNALKTVGFLLGDSEGDTAHATVQWQVYVDGIEAAHRRIKRLLEWFYTTALLVRGRQCRVEVTFNEIRKTDRILDATAESTEIANARQLYELGLISHVELSMRLTGKPPAGEPPPTLAEQAVASAASAASNAPATNLTLNPADNQGNRPTGVDAAMPDTGLPPSAEAGLTQQEGDIVRGGPQTKRTPDGEPSSRNAPDGEPSSRNAPDDPVGGDDYEAAALAALRSFHEQDLIDLVTAGDYTPEG